MPFIMRYLDDTYDKTGAPYVDKECFEPGSSYAHYLDMVKPILEASKTTNINEAKLYPTKASAIRTMAARWGAIPVEVETTITITPLVKE